MEGSATWDCGLSFQLNQFLWLYRLHKIERQLPLFNKGSWLFGFSLFSQENLAILLQELRSETGGSEPTTTVLKSRGLPPAGFRSLRIQRVEENLRKDLLKSEEKRK